LLTSWRAQAGVDELEAGLLENPHVADADRQPQEETEDIVPEVVDIGIAHDSRREVAAQPEVEEQLPGGGQQDVGQEIDFLAGRELGHDQHRHRRVHDVDPVVPEVTCGGLRSVAPGLGAVHGIQAEVEHPADHPKYIHPPRTLEGMDGGEQEQVQQQAGNPEDDRGEPVGEMADGEVPTFLPDHPDEGIFLQTLVALLRIEDQHMGLQRPFLMLAHRQCPFTPQAGFVVRGDANNAKNGADARCAASHEGCGLRHIPRIAHRLLVLAPAPAP
jgi:hypothetical protein